MTRSPEAHSDDSAHADPVERCWRMRFSVLDANADARIAGATSLDLLGLELDLRRETGRAVSLDTIDGAVTLAAVRAAVEEAEPIAAVITSVSTDDEIQDPTATTAQTSQWLAERLRPRHRGYLVPLLIELPEGVSWRRLSTAVRCVLALHPALRTTIAPDTSEPPVLRQRIAPTP